MTHPTSSPRRNSSGDSHETGQSDPKKWFDQSNENPSATFDNNTMDVDPPFFQKESDSSNEDKAYGRQQYLAAPPRLTGAESSSADEYRSVIDDLTVEIQKLKDELKRYKQMGPDMLRKEKLFEIKIHGLPKRKRRELEATLRDFTASLEESPDASSSQRKKSSKRASRDNMYSASGSASKHASSSSGSNARPADSAYASMSTGANSSGTSLSRPPNNSRAKTSEQKVENYLKDIPEGLYPRHVVMTMKEKKKLVVRRLEQLFTGKMGGRPAAQKRAAPPEGLEAGGGALAPVVTGSKLHNDQRSHQPAGLATAVEPSREARILPQERQQSGHGGKNSRSRDNGSASNSNGDQTESGGNGNSSSGANISPTNMPPLPEQRPTHPKDLDPDRVQIPSENMEYIRHLGLVPPELLAEESQFTEDVQPDAEGWVYLNLLCGLAQLHMINVTPSFVRSAVAGLSTKFQLSPDGRKIRWRGGSEGTKFSSDSSGDNSQRSPDTDDSHDPKKAVSRKRQKTGNSTGDDYHSGNSSKNRSKLELQHFGSSDSFHYKPMFAQQESPNGGSSPEDTLSSFGPVDDSNLGESRWGLSGSGTTGRRKRRHDGAIIYYSGAPFCTDLSGDPGDVSPATYMLSSGQDREDPPVEFTRPTLSRSNSGSSLNWRPLIDGLKRHDESTMDIDSMEEPPGLSGDSGNELTDVDLEPNWSSEQQYMEMVSLEPCGLGGVVPEDHFMVLVTTQRPKDVKALAPTFQRNNTDEATDGIICRLATMSTSSPGPMAAATAKPTSESTVEIDYVSGRIKRLPPVPLPPPAIFFPPFSTDGSSDADDDFESDADDSEIESSEELMSRRANPHHSDGYPDGVDLSSGDEDGEDPDDEPETHRMYDVDMLPARAMVRTDTGRQSVSSAEAAPPSVRGRSKSTSEAVARTGGSSAATAGGLESGYSSSDESS
ncbi:frequency clock protein-like protein [Purpureocillium lavendulum]|uniref:Frequency clock protein-like protein n=1 Tax=Purpureocillium lavendulum TaxID=1247861 RepID=A0AB34FPK1_9HYPO|nr:frequency clock protein-like protein [Purpureocillium lavendulum]